MAETLSIERADVLAEAARRIRKHYCERLIELYVVSRHPYPEGGGEGEVQELNLVAILHSPVNVFEETDFSVDLNDALDYEFGYFVSIHVDSPTGDLAEWARKTGVRI